MRDRYIEEDFRGPRGYVRVYYNHDRNEYICKLWQQGERHLLGDYYTDERSDALATAQRMVSEPRQLPRKGRHRE